MVVEDGDESLTELHSLSRPAPGSEAKERRGFQKRVSCALLLQLDCTR
jgi:hypothetical protein